ncbi:MAG TPA: hypothetical protein VGK22_15050 [Candidatus Angelobacter sp.]|jgi:hypothetical protein
MNKIHPIGPYRDVLEARSPLNPLLAVKLGLRKDSFDRVLHHNLPTSVAQYHGIVQDGLFQAVHAFKGLNRPLMHGEDMQADKSILVYSWRPEVDYVWVGSRFDGKIIAKSPPSDRVFVVLVREEPEPNEYAEVGRIFGSIEKWNWVKEDPTFPYAPIEWQDRYTSKLWSREI